MSETVKQFFFSQKRIDTELIFAALYILQMTIRELITYRLSDSICLLHLIINNPLKRTNKQSCVRSKPSFVGLSIPNYLRVPAHH